MQNRQETSSRSYRLASRGREGCRRHKPRLALCMPEPSRLSREWSRRPSTLIGRHRPWRLLIVVSEKVSIYSTIWLINDLLELAFRNVAAEHSDKPIYFVFPALRISSSAGIDSSRGVSVIYGQYLSPPIRIQRCNLLGSIR